LIAAMLLLIIGFGVAMSVLYAQARANLHRAQSAESVAEGQAQRATREAAIAKQIKDFLVGVFKVSDPEVARGKTVTARELLDSAASRVDRELGGQPEVQATLMFTIGHVYENLGLYDEATVLLKRAIEIQERIDPQSLAVAESASTLAVALRAKGELDGAEKAYQEALSIMKSRGGENDIHVILLLQALADLQSARGQLDSAEATLRELLDRHRKSSHGRSGLPSCLNALCGILADKGNYREAVPLMREAIQVSEQDHGEQLNLMSLRGNLGWLLAMDGQNEEAERIIGGELEQRRKILPASHPAIATSLVTMGVIHLNLRHPELAEPLFREALRIREAALGAENQETVECRGFVGESLVRMGRIDEAEPLLLGSFESLRRDSTARPLSKKEAAQRLANLYEVKGESAKVAVWRGIAGQMQGDSR
ncbi:MAG TPA: tetratricopeptide repeat protein, partial [Phycisphaerae bacterium]|nr:tetratricopeptide repeat protein [Phycisphaerae bacterium]